MINNNESFYSVMLRVNSINYYPKRVPKSGPIPGLTTYEWQKEYFEDDDPNGDHTYERTMQTNFKDVKELLFTQEEVNDFIMSPEAFMSENLKTAFKGFPKNWELYVTEYRPQPAKVYNHQDVDGERKALRKAHLLSKMSPEDRALFQK